MSVTKPGVSSSAPPKMIITASVSSAVGIAPRAMVSRKRRHVARPSRFNNHAPSTDTVRRATIVSGVPMTRPTWIRT